eukprot:gene19211-25828_t
MTVLEIGLGCLGPEDGWGGLLMLWRKYFTHIETKVHVIENEPDCRDLFTCGANTMYVGIFLGDQSHVDFLEFDVNSTGPLDLIIDDGSHNGRHQYISFRALWPALKDHGVYTIEDMEGTSEEGIFKLVPELIKSMFRNKTSEKNSERRPPSRGCGHY